MTAFDKPLKPTLEQAEILDVFFTGSDLVIEALAATGKSSTLCMVGNSTQRRGVGIAFNKAVAQEMKQRSSNNVAWSTGHSLAFRAMKDQPFMQRLNGPIVTAKQLAEDHLGVTRWIKMEGRKPISTWKVASLAVQTVRRFCNSDDAEVGPKHVPFLEGADMAILRREVTPFAREIWTDLQKPHGFARFEHDCYMKIWSLGNPVVEADFLLLDEMQDADGCLAGVLRKQNHLQRVLVGDSNQRIFSWRGSVDLMREFPEAETRYLSQAFRFGDAVAEEANRWLDYLEAPVSIRGLSSINSRLEYIEQPDAILCRTNADVMEQAMAAQQRGFDVAVIGGTDEISSFAAGVEELRRDGKTKHRDLSIFKTWPDVQAYVREEKPGGGFGTAVRLIERYGTTLVRQIAANCVDVNKADFVISTVHKIKGMQYSKVLLDANLAPDEASDQEDMGKGELRLNYVAVTRAQHVLDATALESFHSRRARRRELAASSSGTNNRTEG